MTHRHTVRFVLVLLVFGVSVAGRTQTPTASDKPAKAAPAAPVKPVVPTKPKSPCPDSTYQTACDSYAELAKAHDEGVTVYVGKGGVGVVCFRGAQDSFFVLTLEEAHARGKVVITTDEGTR